MRIRSIITSSMGNILEWYDFGLFSIFSPLFSQLFFPVATTSVNLISMFTIFAVGFVFRPLGGLLFGYCGDKWGRAKTLRLSILMISLPTLLIGFLPTYHQAGILAPILLMLIRIWQGISLGGEFSGNIIYLAETSPSNIRATLTSFACTGANLGILLATVIGASCSYFFAEDTLRLWGWRLPYILSGVFSLFIFLTRLKIDETHVFEYLQKKKLLAKNPIKTALQKNIPQMLRTIGIACIGSTYYYFAFIFLPVYMTQHLNFSLSRVSGLMTFFFVIMLILVPLAGLLCDYVGRRKMLLFNAIAIFVIVVPAFYFISSGKILFVLPALLLLTIISSLEQATTTIAVVENYPVPARYTGLSLSYNITNGLLGGTVPLVSTALLTTIHTSAAPAFYIMLTAMITGIVVYFMCPKPSRVP